MLKHFLQRCEFRLAAAVRVVEGHVHLGVAHVAGTLGLVMASCRRSSVLCVGRSNSVTKRPIFEFISPDIHPNDACMVFPFEDDYSFGILQSEIHWIWFVAKCSTLKSDFRYTSDTVFDTFPWPQKPSPEHVIRVAAASYNFRAVRRKLMSKANLSLRKLYRLVELPGENPLKTAQADLDFAVREAYGPYRCFLYKAFP